MRNLDIYSNITQSFLKERFHYNPETGIFTHKIPIKYQQIKPGDIAGGIRDGEYWYISINRKHYKAHRLAWLYVHGEWPEIIDHKNGIKSDNRINNLRNSTPSQNSSNGKKRSNNTSGFKGVTKAKNRWRAQITHQRQVIYLGQYLTREEAHAVYWDAAIRLQNEFARAA